MELEKCPFCKSDDVAVCYDGELSWVTCNTCMAEGPVKEEPEEAIAAWNRRAD